MQEGSLESPVRHPVEWKSPEFYDQAALFTEMERVFDICHGCRRCFNLCHAFPTLFDLVDDSESMEVNGVAKADYWKVVQHCYLCDMCYMSKCPYVPPHEWNIDFPHLMLRAKAVQFKLEKPGFRDNTLSATDAVGKLLAKPLLASIVNTSNNNSIMRRLTQSILGVHAKAKLPVYDAMPFSKRKHEVTAVADSSVAKVALFTTCYANYNQPGLAEDLLRILQHNGLETTVNYKHCCGMPKLELGDLDSVQAAKDINIKALIELVDAGWHIVAPIPSCVLMFKQELPLLFPQDQALDKVSRAIYDPFEYLMMLHKQNKLKLDFKRSLGKVAYHAACHLRVQNIGHKTKECLELVQDTQVELIERCSGHNGTYAVKLEFHETSMKLCKPVINKVKSAAAEFYSSDCPMAGDHISNGLGAEGGTATHPLKLLRLAYGI